MNKIFFIDGDFPTGKGCKYHCSPTCHPSQVGPEWVYGCTHPAWPQNIAGDFVPIVDCGGKMEKCEVIHAKCWNRYIDGLKRRIENATAKLRKLQREMDEACEIIEGDS